MDKAFSKEEIRKLPKEIKSKIYNKAFKEFDNLYKVNEKMIKLMSLYKSKGYKIIILTGRESALKEKTEKVLIENKIPYDTIIFRESVSIPDEEWKFREISKLCKNCCEILLFEDKLENIQYIKSQLSLEKIKYFLVKNSEIKEIK